MFQFQVAIAPKILTEEDGIDASYSCGLGQEFHDVAIVAGKSEKSGFSGLSQFVPKAQSRMIPEIFSTKGICLRRTLLFLKVKTRSWAIFITRRTMVLVETKPFPACQPTKPASPKFKQRCLRSLRCGYESHVPRTRRRFSRLRFDPFLPRTESLR